MPFGLFWSHGFIFSHVFPFGPLFCMFSCLAQEMPPNMSLHGRKLSACCEPHCDVGHMWPCHAEPWQHQGFQKNEYWATCKASCTPGIDPADPPEYATPWTCKAIAGVCHNNTHLFLIKSCHTFNSYLTILSYTFTQKDSCSSGHSGLCAV